MEGEENRRQKEENKKLFRSMTLRQKLGYIKDYYLLKTLIIAGICILAAFLIWNFVRPQPGNILTVYVYDQTLDKGATDTLTEQTAEVLGTEESDRILIRSGLDSSNSQDTAIASVLSFNQAIDVIICPRELFESFAANGYFLNLDDVLSSEDQNALADNLIAAAGYQESDDDSIDGTGKGSRQNYGISLSNSSKWNASAGYSDSEMVAGIIATTENRSNAVQFLKNLF
ncbi:MAG: hypothetical protein ACI4ET_08530 [Bilifractor sp.]|nr:hypothetical protein [Eubacterium sp.]